MLAGQTMPSPAACALCWCGWCSEGAAHVNHRLWHDGRIATPLWVRTSHLASASEGPGRRACALF